MTLNFELDVDMLQSRKRLQCSGMRACSGHIEWNAGSSPCKTLMLAPANKQVSGGVQVKVQRHLRLAEMRGACSDACAPAR